MHIQGFLYTVWSTYSLYGVKMLYMVCGVDIMWHPQMIAGSFIIFIDNDFAI